MIADIASDGVLGSTIEQVGEVMVKDILVHLAYLKDMAVIRKAEADAARGVRTF